MTQDQILWTHPEVLQLLWLMPIILIALFVLLKKREHKLRSLAEQSLMDVLLPKQHIRRTRARLVFTVLGLCCLVIALAGPRWGFDWQKVTGKGLDIMVVLDTSKSMLAEDIKPNRLTQAKWSVRDFIRLLKGDRVGLVAFSGGSFMQCPMTADYSSFLLMLDDLYAGIIPVGGTSIELAMESAIKGFEADGDSDKAIILISDGEDHSESLDDIIQKLKDRQIHVYAIGVGSLEGELIPERSKDGRLQFHKDKNGNVVKTALEEENLKRIALETGGMYVRSVSGDFGVETIYTDGLSTLNKGTKETKMIKKYKEKYYWFLAAALVFFVLEAVFAGKFRRKS